jgi:hypothetical protein
MKSEALVLMRSSQSAYFLDFVLKERESNVELEL